MKNLRTNYLFLCMTVLFLSSCANINIVKRTHRPGYHIDIVKKNKHRQGRDTETVDVNKRTKAAQATATLQPKKAKVATVHNQAPVMEASVSNVGGILTKEEVRTMVRHKKDRTKDSKATVESKEIDFARYFSKRKKKAATPIDFSGAHWSDWAVFGAGAVSATFGIIGLITAFFGFSFWPAAIFFGVAAIVFYFIAKKRGWASNASMQKWGLIMGIAGASLGLASMIIWAIARASWRRRGGYGW